MHHPIPAVIAILQHEDRFLLVRRRNEPDAGLWGHAGGKVEWGEDLDAAALRELREETGIRAEVAGRLAPLDCLSGEAPAHHFILCPVVCRYRDGEPVAGDDADAVAWFSLEAMRREPARFSQGVIGICEQAQAVYARAGQPPVRSAASSSSVW